VADGGPREDSESSTPPALRLNPTADRARPPAPPTGSAAPPRSAFTRRGVN